MPPKRAVTAKKVAAAKTAKAPAKKVASTVKRVQRPEIQARMDEPIQVVRPTPQIDRQSDRSEGAHNGPTEFDVVERVPSHVDSPSQDMSTLNLKNKDDDSELIAILLSQHEKIQE